MSTNPTARAWIELDSSALRENYARLRGAVGRGVAMLPMVKADAYGLGAAAVIARLERMDPWGYGVATIDEGIALRRSGVTRPVVVFSPVFPAALDEAVAADLQLSVGSLSAARAIVERARARSRVAEVHVEIDTGMGRSGVDWTHASEWLADFRDLVGAHLRWVGCYTHLHSADMDGEAVAVQWHRFSEVLEGPAGPEEGVLCHVLNSSGVLRTPEYAADAVRPGIFLYGGSAGRDLAPPRPVLAVRVRVAHLRDAREGSTLGYGATYRATGPERWATLAIGYGDGLPRALGNRGEALVRGVRVPVIGRISMDVAVVNITGVAGVGVGDVATVIGRDGEQEITIDEVAAHADTISYEVMTGLSGRLPRIWRDVDEA